MSLVTYLLALFIAFQGPAANSGPLPAPVLLATPAPADAGGGPMAPLAASDAGGGPMATAADVGGGPM